MNSAIIEFVMEQACPGCGFISDRPSRYCRQCGKQLFAESELTSAETRNYDPNRVQAANAPYSPHRGLPGNEMNEVQETTRFYSPPPASKYEIPEKKKSRIGLWITLALLCFLLIGGGMVALFVVRAVRPPLSADTSVRDALRELDKLQRELELATQLPPPAPPLPAGAAKPGIPEIFDKYKYPDAQVDRAVSMIGSGVVKMSTTDTFDDVKDFYERVTGVAPLTENRDNEKEQVIFRTSNSPQIFVIIGSHDEFPGKTQIVLIHSSFQIPHKRY